MVSYSSIERSVIKGVIQIDVTMAATTYRRPHFAFALLHSMPSRVVTNFHSAHAVTADYFRLEPSATRVCKRLTEQFSEGNYLMDYQLYSTNIRLENCYGNSFDNSFRSFKGNTTITPECPMT